MKASPSRSVGSTCTGASTLPRRDETRTRSPSASPSALGVLGRDVERLAPPDRRRVAARSGRRCCTSRGGGRSSAGAGTRRRARPRGGSCSTGDERRGLGPASGIVLPQPRVQEQLARVLLVGARPLQAAELLEPPRSSSRRASARASAARPRPPRRSASAQSAPSRRASSEMISMSSRASPGGSSALRTRWTRRSLEVTVPSDSHHDAGGRQHDVGELGGLGQEDVLDDEAVETRQAARACGACRPRSGRGSRRRCRRRSARRAPSPRTSA